jgi:hypothetical protein
MFQQMQARGFGTNCPNGGMRPQDGTGYRNGRGGGMGGGRWNQNQAPQTNP